ncbi:unnamed protein product [Rotaria sordida]|uniref:Methionyl/Leucyl tRNA synthetase domain-containing protein n=1 Tax=Rotaria sordida TaxID=392033 RepID=A0A814VXP7_9BILA|nr:unnamed protein product [Rotaria sordida]CAF3962594.1 unnamed protein product [Rotaria sordida]
MGIGNSNTSVDPVIKVSGSHNQILVGDSALKLKNGAAVQEVINTVEDEWSNSFDSSKQMSVSSKKYCQLKNYNTLCICGTDEYDTATETKVLEQKHIPRDIWIYIKKIIDGFNNNVEQLYCDTCQHLLADRYIAGTYRNTAYKFDDTRCDQYDKCEKLIIDIERIDPKCQICHSTLPIRKFEHLFHAD